VPLLLNLTCDLINFLNNCAHHGLQPPLHTSAAASGAIIGGSSEKVISRRDRSQKSPETWVTVTGVM
jgi:hypothetical protein